MWIQDYNPFLISSFPLSHPATVIYFLLGCIGLSLAKTGDIFPLVSPVLGWIGDSLLVLISY